MATKKKSDQKQFAAKKPKTKKPVPLTRAGNRAQGRKGVRDLRLNGVKTSAGAPASPVSAMSTAVFPGSFDPITLGHVDIIERALTIFDRVVVGVLINHSKHSLFSPGERVALIKEQFKAHGDRVQVESFTGLLVRLVNRVKSRVIIRGLRAISDFDYEAQMALVNRRLAPHVETFFMTAREENSYISSSIVKQVALLGGDVSAMVPICVSRELSKRYQDRK